MAIRVLEEKVISQIAAGEVVERPASVAKELIENSLDAGASQISIEIRGGGLGLIRVTDDGGGIPAAEVELAFQRHATSKVASLSDLESIATLGFRGEALPSIAAVAGVEMITGAAGETAGTLIGLRDGAVVRKSQAGRPVGTTVTVSDLFARVPGRRKFLKSPNTENSRVAAVASAYALAFPGVRFSLLLDGRVALRTPGSGRLIDSLVEVYGQEVARNMLCLEEPDWDSAEGLKVTGMVSSPALSRTGRGYLNFLINHRWVTSRLLARAVEDAYHGLLAGGKHPVAIIEVTMSPEEVDVNVHPTKAEVRFRDEHAVFTAVQRAVRRTLVGEAPVPRVAEAAPLALTPRPPSAQPGLALAHERSAGVLSPEPKPTPRATLPVLRIIGQVLATYITAEGPDGLYLIDQHAAHERILKEKLAAQLQVRGIVVQGLLEPVTFEVSPGEAAILGTHHHDLADFGFNLEPFGEGVFLVRAVPALLGGSWEAALRELVASRLDGAGADWTEAALNLMACHGAVRAGKVLSHDEMRELVRELEKAELPNTCPHGRPTMISLSLSRIEREFGRR
ncbi:MAG: DNA mismatch repair endonuclease MutL [Chloroflexota bacterium]